MGDLDLIGGGPHLHELGVYLPTLDDKPEEGEKGWEGVKEGNIAGLSRV